MKKWWFLPVLIGIVLRLLIMPLTYHPDILGHSSVAYFFAYKGVADPYSFLANLPGDHPLVKNIGVNDVFIYPPLAYYTLGIFRVITKPFTDPNFVPYLWENLSSIYTKEDLAWHLFAFKFPYIFFDVALGFILASFFDKPTKKRSAIFLWMLNPVTLYATFMLGQLDLLPTFFFVLSIYFVKKGKAIPAMISLGVGGSYKMFPLLLIVPLACHLSRNLFGRLKLLIWGILPFVIITLPFLASTAFRQMVLFSPKSQKMLFMIWKMTSAEGIYPFVFILSAIYFYSYYAKKLSLLFLYSSVLLLIFSVTHFHPQWFLWVTPLFVWDLVENNGKSSLLVAVFLISWFVLTLFFEPSLSVGLFAPMNPLLAKSQGLSDIAAKYTDVFQIKSLVRSFFAAGAAYYVYRLLPKNGETDK